jgi:hypothetical protein
VISFAINIAVNTKAGSHARLNMVCTVTEIAVISQT